MKKKALMVAYYFPPMGGSGVQRTTKFVKYLRDFDWEPIVFTRDTHKLPLRDESLVKDIPDGVKIIHTPAWDLTALPGILGLFGKIVARKILIPDGEKLWQMFSASKAIQAVQENKADLIYTTSSPYSDHLLGLSLKKKFPGIPWVADFRDEWTNNPYTLDNPHYKLRADMERKMEREVLLHADCLITNTPVMMQNFVRDNPSVKDKFFVIPNGYDEEDFAGISTEAPNNSKFTLTYTGLLYGRRKPDLFFEAVSKLIAENRIDRSKVDIKLIGNYKLDYMNKLIESYSLQGVVRILPYMKHRECIEQLSNSDALLLIEGAGPGAEAFYTGKVFEYMKTGRPVLAMIPARGAAAQLVRDTRIGYVSDFNDVAATGENMLKLYNSWMNKENSFSPDWELIKKFERKVLTENLVKVFEEAVDKIKR